MDEFQTANTPSKTNAFNTENGAARKKLKLKCAVGVAIPIPTAIANATIAPTLVYIYI